MCNYLAKLGGTVTTSTRIENLGQLPATDITLCDVTPRQLRNIAENRLSISYRRKLGRYRYGPGVFKVDYALNHAIPWKAAECLRAATVHVAGSFEEIAVSEEAMRKGRHADKPFIILTQPSLFDPTRAPEGRHTAWAYCHVPNGSTIDMTEAIEKQVERFAPGFRERILAKHVMNTAQLQDYNANYVGGDINGGVIDLQQLFTRPALRWSPYRTSAKGIYICSASTPPGGGVHGMCGHHAATRALKDIFKL
jgi:uncharacterized repeat protein (TIGR01451 family)